MKRITLAVSAVALVLAGAAFAAEEHHGHGGPLTRAEAQAHAAQAFDKLDANHDGKLDQADRAAHMGMMFDKMDANHDGAISREEFMAAHQHRMGMHADHEGDHDGDHTAGPEGRPGKEGHHGGMRHGMERMAMLGAIMHLADPAHTGTITRDAFIGATLKLFDMADTNHDGIVTREEHRAAQAQMRAKWREQAMMPGHGGDMPPPPAGQ